MMRTSALMFVLLAVPLAVRAETVGFTYSFTLDSSTSTTFGPGPIFLDAKVMGGGAGFMVNNGNTVAAFAAGSGGGTATGPFTGSLTAAISLGRVSFEAGPGGAAFRYGFVTQFNGRLHIRDAALLQEADVPITLVFSGSVAPSGNQYAHSVIGPPFPGTPIGSHRYSAGYAVASVSPAGGDLMANVFVDWPGVGGPLPPPIPTPEPSALLLGGFGLLTLARAAWHMRPRR